MSGDVLVWDTLCLFVALALATEEHPVLGFFVLLFIQ